MTQKQIRVSPDKDGWRRGHQPWNKRDSFHINTKVEAMTKVQKIAKNQALEIKIQNKNGKISWGNSYGKDPFPPRG
jgi:hypothetical protein